MTSWPIILITIATIIYAAVVAFILGASSARAEPPATRPDTQRVYVMYPDTKWGWLFGPSKIGVSNNAARRVRTFQTAHYHDITVHMTLTVRDARDTEYRAHRYLHRFRRKGEWFNLPPAFAATAVRMVANQTVTGMGPAMRRVWLWLVVGRISDGG